MTDFSDLILVVKLPAYQVQSMLEEEKVDEALMESITKRVAKRILMEALNAKK